MKHLICLAHGSRKDEANNEFTKLIEKVKTPLLEHYDFISPAFLEFSSPSLQEEIDIAIKNTKITQIIIFPYFLHNGNHVSKDINNIVKSYSSKKIDLKILPHFGAYPEIEDIIVQNLSKK
jgi:sirohydrochlorin ferrochelatase